MWTFLLSDVEFRDVHELAKGETVKIVACDGKSNGSSKIFSCSQHLLILYLLSIHYSCCASRHKRIAVIWARNFNALTLGRPSSLFFSAVLMQIICFVRIISPLRLANGGQHDQEKESKNSATVSSNGNSGGGTLAGQRSCHRRKKKDKGRIPHSRPQISQRKPLVAKESSRKN